MARFGETLMEYKALQQAIIPVYHTAIDPMIPL